MAYGPGTIFFYVLLSYSDTKIVKHFGLCKLNRVVAARSGLVKLPGPAFDVGVIFAVVFPGLEIDLECTSLAYANPCKVFRVFRVLNRDALRILPGFVLQDDRCAGPGASVAHSPFNRQNCRYSSFEFHFYAFLFSSSSFVPILFGISSISLFS